jgi:hypothetical protein
MPVRQNARCLVLMALLSTVLASGSARRDPRRRSAQQRARDCSSQKVPGLRQQWPRPTRPRVGSRRLPVERAAEPILRWSNPLGGRKAVPKSFLLDRRGGDAALSMYEYTRRPTRRPRAPRILLAAADRAALRQPAAARLCRPKRSRAEAYAQQLKPCCLRPAAFDPMRPGYRGSPAEDDGKTKPVPCGSSHSPSIAMRFGSPRT